MSHRSDVEQCHMTGDHMTPFFFDFSLIISAFFNREKRLIAHLKELNEKFRMVHLKSSIPHHDVIYHMICDFSKILLQMIEKTGHRSRNLGLQDESKKKLMWRRACEIAEM